MTALLYIFCSFFFRILLLLFLVLVIASFFFLSLYSSAFFLFPFFCSSSFHVYVTLRVASQVKREWRGLATVSMLTVAVRLLFFFLKWISEWYSIRWPVNTVMSYAWLFFLFFSCSLRASFSFFDQKLLFHVYIQKKHYLLHLFFFLLCLTTFFSFLFYYYYYFVLFCLGEVHRGCITCSPVCFCNLLPFSCFFFVFLPSLLFFLFKLCSAVKEARKSWRTKNKQTKDSARCTLYLLFDMFPEKKKESKAMKLQYID